MDSNRLLTSSNRSDTSTYNFVVKIKKKKEEFVGEYVGRQLVKSDVLPRETYKDIIIIDKDQPVIATLHELYVGMHDQFDDEKWIGITRTIVDDEVHNYKLWVDLEPTPIGIHRFRIRALKASETVLQLQLKLVKPFESRSDKSWADNSTKDLSMNEIALCHNLREIAKFSGVVILSFITITGNFLWYCGDFTIKLTHELSNLITVLTPIAFGLIDFMSRCVAGLYWLLYVIWRGILDPRPLSTAPAVASLPPRLPNSYRPAYPSPALRPPAIMPSMSLECSSSNPFSKDEFKRTPTRRFRKGFTKNDFTPPRVEIKPRDTDF